MINQGFDLQRYILPLRLAIKNPRKIRRYVLANKKAFTNWGLLLASIILIYFAFSDGFFSFYYTLSGAIQAFGFVIIALKVYSSRTANGLSLNTFICYSVSLFVKLCSNMFYQGYLPSDSSGDVIFRLCICIAFIAALFMTYLIADRFKGSYNKVLDSIHYLNLIVPALVLACFVHPTLNDRYAGDISWTFAFYLEGLAMLPQLYMLSKQGGEVEVFTSHFVASQGFSLCIATIFWLGCYHEMNQFVGKSWTLFAGNTGYVVLFFHLIQILLFSDFLYEYVKSMKRGLPMIIPV